jgi:hypothetical protein
MVRLLLAVFTAAGGPDGGSAGGPDGDPTGGSLVGANGGIALNINQGRIDNTFGPGCVGSGSGNENDTGENSDSHLHSSSRDGGGNPPGGVIAYGGSGNNFKMPAIPPFQKHDLKKRFLPVSKTFQKKNPHRFRQKPMRFRPKHTER